MSFLSPWMLAALGAILVPIILHLLKRRQVVTIPFGTLRFLKKAATRTRRSAEAENLLLLLLRCLVIGLIALAAAQPVTRRSLLFFGGDVPRVVILLIDHSMSMGYSSGETSRLETAKNQARAIINDLKAGDRVAIIAVSDRARLLISEPTVDHEAARQALKTIQPGFSATNFAPALREAQRIAARESRYHSQIFLLSDCQEAGWRFNPDTVFDAAWKSLDLQFVVVRPDDRTALNGSIGEVRIRPAYLSAGIPNSGEAVLGNFSESARMDLLEVRINDAKISEREAEAPPGGSVRVKFDFVATALAGKSVRGSVRHSADHLPADDEAFFTLSVYQAPKTVVVEGADPSVPAKFRPGYFLGKALSVGNATPGRVQTLNPEDFQNANIDGLAAIFLADVAQLGDRALVKIDRYLQAGGMVVLLPGDRIASAGAPPWAFLPATPDGLLDLPAERLRVQISDAPHEFFSGVWNERKPFPALAQKRMLKWNVHSDSRVLLTAGSESSWPFLIERKIGQGHAIIINASADRSWGDFPLSPAFLPLVHQITLGAAAATRQAQSLTIGQPIPSPGSSSDGKSVWHVRFPNGDVKELTADASGRLLESADVAGCYEILDSNREVVRAFAVNPDPLESDLRPMPDTEISERAPHESLTGAENLSEWLTQRRGLVPVWPALLMLALAAFAAETWYANHLARKRSRGDEVKVQTGRKFRRWMGGFGSPQRADEKQKPEKVGA